MQNYKPIPQASGVTYAVYKDGEIVAAGSLMTCWKYLLNVYGRHFMDTGFASGRDSAAADLAAAGIHIAPVGDLQKGMPDATAA